MENGLPKSTAPSLAYKLGIAVGQSIFHVPPFGQNFLSPLSLSSPFLVRKLDSSSSSSCIPAIFGTNTEACALKNRADSVWNRQRVRISEEVDLDLDAGQKGCFVSTRAVD